MFLLSDNLKRMRKDKGLTQEQLAKHLCVSPQAVSRWENGTTYPDVVMLPAIANYFNVTTDQILGVDIARNEEAITNIILEAQRLQYEKKRKEAVDILKQGLMQFPNNYKIISALIVRMLDYYDELHNCNNPIDNEKEILSQVFEYGDRILNECIDDEIRQIVTAYIAGAYLRINDKENARKMVMKLPSMETSREIQLQICLEGEELTRQLQQNLWDFAGYFDRTIAYLADINYTSKDTKYNFEERIELLKKAIAVYNIIFENGDYGFYFTNVGSLYRQIGACYANKKDKQNTLLYLNKALECAVAYDEKRVDEYKHTSLAVNQLKYNQGSFVTRGYWNTDSAMLLNRLSHERYDFLREDNEFINIMKIAEKQQPV